MWDDGKGGGDSISSLLGQEAEAALLAEAYFRQGRNIRLRNLIQIGEKNPAVLLAARSQWKGQRTEAQAALAAVYLYAGRGEKTGDFSKSFWEDEDRGERADEGDFRSFHPPRPGGDDGQDQHAWPKAGTGAVSGERKRG